MFSNIIIYKTIWKIKNFSFFVENNTSENFKKLSFLSSPLFKVPYNQKWTFYFTLHPNDLKNFKTKGECLSLCLHVYDGSFVEVYVDFTIKFSINTDSYELAKQTFNNETFKKDFPLKCPNLLKKCDFETYNSKSNDDVLLITCLFSKLGDDSSTPILQNWRRFKGTQPCFVSQAKVEITKTKLKNTIENFSSEMELAMKNEPIKLKSFFEKTEKFNMYLWLKGRWNVLEDSYISIAFKTKNTITEYENAHASIALTDNNNNILFAKFFSGVLSSNKKTHFGCDQFIKTEEVFENRENYLKNDTLAIEWEIEVFKEINEPVNEPTPNLPLNPICIKLGNDIFNFPNSTFTNSNFLAGTSTQNTRDMTQTANQN